MVEVDEMCVPWYKRRWEYEHTTGIACNHKGSYKCVKLTLFFNDKVHIVQLADNSYKGKKPNPYKQTIYKSYTEKGKKTSLLFDYLYIMYKLFSSNYIT